MQKSVHTKEYRALRLELRAMREKAGLSQRDLAAKLGVPHSWVAKVEGGERRIDVVELGWFAAACGENAYRILSRIKSGQSAVSSVRHRTVPKGSSDSSSNRKSD
jgi:transcriptional regulator with XRE-family HTH domain